MSPPSLEHPRYQVRPSISPYSGDEPDMASEPGSRHLGSGTRSQETARDPTPAEHRHGKRRRGPSDRSTDPHTRGFHAPTCVSAGCWRLGWIGRRRQHLRTILSHAACVAGRPAFFLSSPDRCSCQLQLSHRMIVRSGASTGRSAPSQGRSSDGSDPSKLRHHASDGHLRCRFHKPGQQDLPPEGCGTWAAAIRPQPPKSGPSCRVPRLPAPPRTSRVPLR